MAVGGALHLRGTPTFIWRAADGSTGRADGIPPDLNAVIASIGK
jgi:thiol:disulfide interchange protein DsbG